ncbi:MAG: hypothetical protein CMJ46_07110 [Planctomyces sp.]|nr:hypothetical protein [Planctomyces sp.]
MNPTVTLTGNWSNSHGDQLVLRRLLFQWYYARLKLNRDLFPMETANIIHWREGTATLARDPFVVCRLYYESEKTLTLDVITSVETGAGMVENFPMEEGCVRFYRE